MTSGGFDQQARRVLFSRFFLAGVLWALAFPALFAQPTASGSILIGVIGALSGPKAPYGISQLRGIQLALEGINQGGGWQGKNLALLSRDDRGDMNQVSGLLAEMIYRDKVLAVIGSTDSGCTHVISMVCVKTHVPHFTCVATDPSITRAGSPWTFRTLADDERQSAALVAYLHASKGGKVVRVLAAPSRYGKMGAKILVRKAREQGFQIADPAWIPRETEALPAVVQTLLADRPQAVILWTLAEEGKAALRELRRQGFSGPVLGGDGLATPAFYAADTALTEGVIMTCPYIEEQPIPENKEFRQRYLKRFGSRPDSFAAHAFDTMQLIFAALKVSDGTRADFRQRVLQVVPFPGATGQLRFDDSGNDIRPVMLAICRQSRLVPLEPSH